MAWFILLVHSAMAGQMWGLETSKSKQSFTSSETNVFSDLRYGYGQIRGVVGDELGVKGSSNGGYLMYDKQDFFSPVISYEAGNTYFNWTKDNSDIDYYSLMPGFGAGGSLKISKFKLYLVAKVGYNITNINDRRLFHPDLYQYEGWQAFSDFYYAGFSLGHITSTYRDFSTLAVWCKIGDIKLFYKKEDFNFDVSTHNFLIKFDF